MRKQILFAVLCIILFQSVKIFSCSIFKYIDTDGVVYFCGNEDWSATDPAIMTMKPDGKSLGVILFGWQRYLPNYPQAGINSEGLCFDWATVPSQSYIFEKGKEDLNVNSLIEILRKCRTVDDAVAYIEKHNFSHLAQEHLMLADRTGKSCVIEFTNGTRKIIRENGRVQFITNFNLSDREKGWYPCERYAKMEKYFNDSNVRFQATKILDDIHQEGTYPTIYSYVFNLTNMDITIYYNHNFHAPKEYKVSKLITENKLLSIK